MSPSHDLVPNAWRGHYAILDPDHSPGGVLETARAILAGGCAVMQLRAKHMKDREHLALACALRSMARAHRVAFVVNDRVDIACLSEADGLHLGQEDFPIREARKIFQGSIGVSTHDRNQAQRAEADGADLIGFGPVFATSSKAHPDAVVGLVELEKVCRSAAVPVVAIGGLDAERARAAHERGASLVAAIRSVSHAPDIAAASRAMHLAAGGAS